MKSSKPFVFKKFQVNHSQSAIKVGFDAVVLGAWAHIDKQTAKANLNVLDVGCGCGVISLMIAQRFSNAIVTGIDIDNESIVECDENFKNCPWSERLNAQKADFFDFFEVCSREGVKFDLIISNPPFFDSGIIAPESPRLKARHQSSLSPMSLADIGSDLLSPDGRIALILPTPQVKELLQFCEDKTLYPYRILTIKDSADKISKRTLIELKHGIKNDCLKSDTLSVRDENGAYTLQYQSLCKDFYLRF